MGLKQRTQSGNYLSIVSGTLRRTVDENTAGAVKREYEDRDKNKKVNKKVKWELIYSELSGFIKSIKFFDGDYGTQLSIMLRDGNENFILQVGIKQNYAKDFMEKLPNIDLSKEVVLSPYDFANDFGKMVSGITVMQDGKKIKSFFYDSEKKTQINGMVQPEKKYSDMSKDDWEAHFIMVRKFLKEYTIKNIIPKLETSDNPVEQEIRDDLNKGYEYPEDEIDPNSIPF
jgi:hypothetical protein